MRKNTLTQIGFALGALVLLAFSVYLVFTQGYSGGVAEGDGGAVLQRIQESQVVYTGFRADVALGFARVFNVLLQITRGSVVYAIILLALLVEIILLYPSILIQLKQKKIHLFHKRIVDLYTAGKMNEPSAEEELYRLYDVNERIHHKGAILVLIQVILFFSTFWGLNLVMNSHSMIAGKWSLINVSLLNEPTSPFFCLSAALIYFIQAIVKMFYRDREDYISIAQTTLAFVFALIGASVVFVFARMFPTALGLYFISLVAFGTLRYILVERHSKRWGEHVRHDLMEMMKTAEPHRNRFRYLTRLWRHIPLVRHVNFSLLEEALSMTLGLILALAFFGAFQKADPVFEAQNIPMTPVTAEHEPMWVDLNKKRP